MSAHSICRNIFVLSSANKCLSLYKLMNKALEMLIYEKTALI